MVKKILITFLFLSFCANIFLFYRLNKTKVILNSTNEKVNEVKLTNYIVDPSKIYLLGDYCGITDHIELFSFEEDTFEVWNRVTSSIEKTKGLKPNTIGKWRIDDHSTAVFSTLYTDEGVKLGDYPMVLTTVGVTGKVIAFENNNIIYDLRYCF